MKHKKLIKIIANTLVVASILVLNPIKANAEWRNNGAGWRYAESNAWSTGWKQIDGKWYYFRSDGYMAKNTYIDGYYLGNNGAWLTDETRAQRISVSYPSNWVKTSFKGVQAAYYLDSTGTNVNLVIEDMHGLSEDKYQKASADAIKNTFSIDNLKNDEFRYKNEIAKLTSFVQKYQGKNFSTLQAIFCHDNTAYIFTITGGNEISSENMKAFNDMLNTVKFVD